MSGPILTPLEDPGALERALGRSEVLIYRHAPGRWQGFMAIGQVRRFALDHPELPVYLVGGGETDPVSEALDRRLDVAQEAPMAILVRSGEPVWSSSRGTVRYAGLETAVRAP